MRSDFDDRVGSWREAPSSMSKTHVSPIAPYLGDDLKVVRPGPGGGPSSFLLQVVRPGAPSSVLAPDSDARRP